MYNRRDYVRLKKATNTVCRYCNDRNKDCTECIVMETLDRIYKKSPYSKDSDNDLKVYKLVIRLLDYKFEEEYETVYYQAHDGAEAELIYEENCERSYDIASYIAREVPEEEVNKMNKAIINWYV